MNSDGKKRRQKREREKERGMEKRRLLVQCWERKRDDGNESSEQVEVRSLRYLRSFGRSPLEFVEHARDIKTSRVIPSGILCRSN